ncbi:Fic family protein [Hanstruepera ponticola]|uniref:Fic family protein n=1 Tax=Hanstruepera ponticola TaxID=2042995 RepID=UPI000CF0FAE2|nr:Fic family protein [Hanstruepera ponticola]
MATPGEKLAASLKELRKLQQNENVVAIKSTEINRTHRERLTKNGFLQEVSKGWYIFTNPNDKPGESTSWFTSYWNFCSRYLEDKYKGEYCLSPEQSLLLHVGNTIIPEQLITKSPNGPNKIIPLLYSTEILELKGELPSKENLDTKNDVKVYNLESSLINIQPIMFTSNSNDIRAALLMIKDASQILAPLLDGAHTRPAGRLAGAFRNMGFDKIADEIINTMKALDHDVREVDPFEEKCAINYLSQNNSPHINRIKLKWSEYKKIIVEHFPAGPDQPVNTNDYLNSIDEIYKTDAYHSLSIERYKVSEELIELVSSGEWDVLENEDHKELESAMAAKGYFDASKEVKSSIEKILNGTNAGKVVDKDHPTWYQKLFSPSVLSGLCKPSDLAGYRNRPIYISNSRHVPMSREAVRDAMPTLFELLINEDHAGTRVVLGHFFFVYIHPYSDGNGRMARFLMNTMLASGNYPWTVIPVERKDDYMNALEEASVKNNIEPFTKFISELVDLSLKGIPEAKLVDKRNK